MSLITTLASGATSDLTNPSAWLVDWAGGRSTASGEYVNEETANTLSVYYACLRNISQDIGKMPFNLYRRRALPRRGQDLLDVHPIQRLMRYKPNPVMTAMNFRMVMQHRVMGWGNAYAEIIRDGMGRPVELWPVHPSRIEPKWGSDNRSVIYEWSDPKIGIRTLGARDIFHLKALGDGIKGMSVLRYGREVIGLGLAAQRNAAAVFGEGLAKRMIAKVKEVMTKEGRKGLRQRIMGDAENDPVGYRKLPILEGDVDLTEAGITPADAQALETREFTIEDIGRFFRVSLAKLQYFKRAQGWSTLDALNTDYANDSLLPWGVCWEEESWDKLLTEDEQIDHAFRFVMQSLLRGDYKTRTEGYARQFAIGVLSPNDIRSLEDMNPITTPEGDDDLAGDRYYVQSGFVPLADSGNTESNIETSTPATQPTPPFPDTSEGTADDDEQDGRAVGGVDTFGASIDAMWRVSLDVASRMIKRETKRVTSAIERNATNAPRFSSWATKFVGEQRNEVVCAYLPIADGIKSIAQAHNVRLVIHEQSPSDVIRSAVETIQPPTVGAWRDVLQQTDDERATNLSNSVMNALLERTTEES